MNFTRFLLSLVCAVMFVACNNEGVALGGVAPKISVKNPHNEAVQLEDFPKKAVVLRFWNRGCAICMREMPYLQKIQEEYGEKVVILAINTHDSLREIEQVGKTLGLTYPLLRDDLDITARRYGVVAIPTMFLIDANGKVRDKIYGEQPWNSVRTRILGIL